MTRVLIAVSGSDHWMLADGSRHPCGYWPEELAVPHEAFTKAGWDVTVATPGGTVPTVPGGHGPMEDLATSTAFGTLVAGFTALGKPAAAVCHGPAALLPAVDADGKWLFAGRRVTGFTNTEEQQVGFADRARWLLEDRLTEAGGRFEDSGWPRR
jgi:putative intracellular protease/amidase